jgi:hypothetical protein
VIKTMAPRDLAFAGVFGAAAMLLPVLFHVLQLGKVFMPMYLPLVALAFFVRPSIAGTTALIVPVLSGLFTGMPPFHPPIALMKAIELGAMGVLIALVVRRFPRASPYLVLVPVLLTGRVAYVGMVYVAASLMDLPAGFVAGASLLSGWPGVVLMIVVVPPLVMTYRRRVYGLGRQKECEE